MLKCTVKNASKMQGNIKQKALMKIQTKLRVQKNAEKEEQVSKRPSTQTRASGKSSIKYKINLELNLNSAIQGKEIRSIDAVKMVFDMWLVNAVNSDVKQLCHPKQIMR